MKGRTILDELQTLCLGLGYLEMGSEKEICVQAVLGECCLGSTSERKQGKQEWKEEGLNCDAVTTEASHDSLGALELGWPFRVVLN